MSPRFVEGYGHLSRSDGEKDNGNDDDPAGNLDSDASWFSPCLATQQKLGLWSKWWTGDNLRDPADSGLDGSHLRLATRLSIVVV